MATCPKCGTNKLRKNSAGNYSCRRHGELPPPVNNIQFQIAMGYEILPHNGKLIAYCNLKPLGPAVDTHSEAEQFIQTHKETTCNLVTTA